jgi:hypothetical protein
MVDRQYLAWFMVPLAGGTLIAELFGYDRPGRVLGANRESIRSVVLKNHCIPFQFAGGRSLFRLVVVRCPECNVSFVRAHSGFGCN